MRTLIAVEMRRFVARRLVRFLAALAVLGIVIGGSVTFAKSHRADGRALDEVRRVAVADCLAGRIGPPPEEVAGDPFFRREEFCAQESFVGDPRFHLVELIEIAKGVSAPLIIISLLVAASFFGAEWHHRTITTTLTWEPRRTRVLLAKAIAGAAVTFLGALALLTLLGLVLTPAGVVRGTTDGIGGAWFRELAGTILRASTMAALASGIGLALASIGRHTAAALGVGFFYFAVLERMIAGLRPKWQPWLVGDLAALFVGGGRQDLPFGSRSVAEAGVILSVYSVVLLAVATALFRRRDVP